MKIISFVIPVFRNEGSLRLLYERITGLVSTKLNDFGYEFVFVNDGSDDNSLEELMNIAKTDINVKVISFTRNFGQVPAIVAGTREVKGDVAIIMSADLQDPPEQVLEMLKWWQNDYDIVISHREAREDTLFAKLSSAFFYNLIKISIPKMPKGGFDFILLSKKAIRDYNSIDDKNRFLQGDILWLGYNVKFLSYKREKRLIGKSQWSLSKKLKYFIDGVLTTSYWPLRLVTFLGISATIISILYTIFIVYERMANNTPFQGWAPIMILILLIGGLILFTLGIIGEYIWRIYDESKKRPYYLIKDKFNCE